LEPAKDNQVLKTIEIELFPEDKIMTVACTGLMATSNLEDDPKKAQIEASFITRDSAAEQE